MNYTNDSTKASKEVLTLVKQVKDNPKFTLSRSIQADGRAVLHVIRRLVSVYWSKSDLNEDTEKAILKMLLRQFGPLSVSELEQACELWSAGELDVKEGETYGKDFTPGNFGKVLSAYVKTFRRKAVKEYWQEENAQQREQMKADEDKKRADFNKWFLAMIPEQKGKHWSDLQSYWYDAAIRLNVIAEPDTNVKWEYMEKAKIEYYKTEAEKQTKLEENTFRALVLRDQTNKIKEGTIKSIAKRMILAALL